jgi:hypothetical protein
MREKKLKFFLKRNARVQEQRILWQHSLWSQLTT